MARDRVPLFKGARVSIIGTLGAFTCVNTLFFLHDDPVNIFNLTAFNNALYTAWSTHYLSVLSSDYTLDGFRAVRWAGLFTTSAFRTADAGSVGAIASSSLPGNDAMLVNFGSNRRDKHTMGRNYLPAVPQSDVSSGGIISSGHIISVKAAYEALFLVTPATWQWVVCSQFENGAPRSGAVATPVSFVVPPNEQVAQMRRRVGSNKAA